MNKEEFLKELADILLENDLTENQSLSSLANYDSMAILGIIAMIGRRFGMKVNVDEIRDFKTTGDYVKLLSDKLSS